ncbi:hypothetical protein U1Q18_011886 [Sarracenia purpurea var. burkii]
MLMRWVKEKANRWRVEAGTTSPKPWLQPAIKAVLTSHSHFFGQQYCQPTQADIDLGCFGKIFILDCHGGSHSLSGDTKRFGDMMDHKTWLWKKKPTEKTVVTTDKANLSQKGKEKEVNGAF